jgi:DNA-binding MarR family transcriptional regulator
MSTVSNRTPAHPEPPIADRLTNSFEAMIDAYARWARGQAASSGGSASRLRLLYALHCEGPQKMASLADTLGVTPRNVTALVDGLQADGLIRRRSHPTDRRVTLVELTAAAPDTLELMTARRASIAELFGCLSEEEQRDFLRLTQRLGDRLRERTAAEAEAR